MRISKIGVILDEKLKKGLIDELTFLKANIQLSNIMEKGGTKGEGSRGGKVIGHTKSGKPIYAKYNHSGHKNFSEKDHYDSFKLKRDLASTGEKIDNEMYDDALEHHKNATGTYLTGPGSGNYIDPKLKEEYEKHKKNIDEMN